MCYLLSLTIWSTPQLRHLLSYAICAGAHSIHSVLSSDGKVFPVHSTHFWSTTIAVSGQGMHEPSLAFWPAPHSRQERLLSSPSIRMVPTGQSSHLFVLWSGIALSVHLMHSRLPSWNKPLLSHLVAQEWNSHCRPVWLHQAHSWSSGHNKPFDFPSSLRTRCRLPFG